MFSSGDLLSPDVQSDDLNFDFFSTTPNVLSLNIYKGESNFEDFLYPLEIEFDDETGNFWNVEAEGDTLKILKDGSLFTKLQKIRFQTPGWLRKPVMNIPDKWISWTQKLGKDSKIYGLGEKTRYLEKSGARYEMWNTDPGGFYKHNEDPLSVSVPFFLIKAPALSAGGGFIGIFVANPQYIQFDVKYLTGEGTLGTAVNSESVLIFLISGDSPDKIVETYTTLTGKPRMFPRWALGYHHSKYGMPETQEEAIELTEKFIDKDIPLDSLYLDIQHMQDHKIFTWDKDRFPDPEDMLEKLRELGVDPVVIQDPGIKIEKDYSVYESANKNNVFVEDSEGEDFVGMLWPGLCSFPDFLQQSVRTWWGRKNSEVLRKGVSGIWNDMNEPAIFFGKRRFSSLLSEISKNIQENSIKLEDFYELEKEMFNSTEGMVHQDDDGNEVDHFDVHNLYALLEAEGTLMGYKLEKPNARPFILSRSGCPGIQKKASVWTGDNSSTWEHMEMSIQMILNLGISGLPFVGADVGGFDGNVEPELLVRWVQLGSMIPLFRNHSSIGTVSQEPWSFGSEYEEIMRRYIKFRYELLPYLYTLHYKSHRTGIPIVRSIFFEFPDDKEAYKIETQFLVGDSLLVAPVVKREVEERRVYLPFGSGGEELKWENWWTGRVRRSGHHVVSSPLDRMPIYLKESSCVPLMDPVQNTKEIGDTLYLRCNLEDRVESQIYWDDGNTMDFKKGDYFLGVAKVWKNGENIDFSIEPKHECYDPFWDFVNVLEKTSDA